MDVTNFNRDRKEKRRPSVDLNSMVFGKVPPQAKELEEAVLGAIMLEKRAYDDISDKIKPQVFYIDAHQRIFKAMQDLVAKSQPIDILTVVEQLRFSEELELVGGSYYVTKLTNTVVSSANIESHAKIILQKHVQREIIRICGEIIGQAYEDLADAGDLLDFAQTAMGEMDEHFAYGDMIGMDTALVETMQQVQAWQQMDTPINGVPSGYPDVDKATRGWQGGDLIIIAARPSVGKTAFALNLARNAAMDFLTANPKFPKSVAIWSLEMKYIMLVLRMLAAESKELLYKIQTGRLEEHEMKRLYAKGVQILSRMPIFFDQQPGLTLAKLRAKARRLKKKNKLGLIIIDYLQLMTPENGGNREQEISKISRGLKQLAQELDVPIIALSQLSRKIEERTGALRQPQLSDLRESGAIEQDADVVGFLWGPSEAEIDNDLSLLTRRYFRIAKQRNGMLGKWDFDFKNDIQLFEDLSRMSEQFPVGPGYRPITAKDYTEPSRQDDVEPPFPL